MDKLTSAYLAEHEAAPEEFMADKIVSQTPEQQKIVNFVSDLFLKAKRYRQNFDKDWLQYYQFFKGEQWPNKRPSYRHSEVLNFIHPTLQTIVSILTDSRPNVQVLPENPSDYEFAEILNQVCSAKWDKLQWSRIVAECILDASIYGTALAPVLWDKEKYDGVGDIGFYSEDPFYCYPDPESREVNDQWGNFFITAIPTPVGKVKADYPELAHLITPDIASMGDPKLEKIQNNEVNIQNYSESRTFADGGRATDPSDQDKVLLITCYLKSDEMVEKELELNDPESNQVRKAYQMMKKYPNGRVIKIANNILLSDEQNPYIDGKFPYTKLIDMIMPREFWGQGTVQQLKGPQQIINKIMSYILDVMIFMGNPIWVVDTTAGVETENLFNIPGLVIEKNPEGNISRQEGTQLQPYIIQTYQLIKQDFEKISGINEVSQGAASLSDTSGYAIEQLQEAAQTKLRSKSRNVEYWLKDVGELMVSRIMQYYTVPRIIRITENMDAAKYFKFYVDTRVDEAGEQRKVAIVSEFQDINGQYVEGPVKELELKGNLDIRITTGTTLPFAKQVKSRMAERYFDKGILDAEDLLTVVEWPNKEKIIEKINQRQQAAQEAAAAQAAQEQGQQPQ